MKRILIVPILVLSCQNALAWGNKGQEVTTQIAEQLMSPNALQKARALNSGRELSTLAVWADAVRKDPRWKHTKTWHFLDMAKATGTKHKTHNPPEDTFDAIDYCIAQLQSNIPDAEKKTWLAFLVHFIGDIHQPMHIGNPSDRGGNLTEVTYGRQMNLHALWDSPFVEKAGLSPKAYADKLLGQGRSRKALDEDLNLDQIADENIAYRNFIYSAPAGKIDATYEKRAIEITEERLWMSGVRLAGLLNRIFQ